MKIENALDYCVEIYDIISLLCLKKKDNVYQELINHIRYLTESDQIAFIRFLPTEMKGINYTFGLSGNTSELVTQVNEELMINRDQRIDQIVKNGITANILYVSYDKDLIGSFVVLTDRNSELNPSFFEGEYTEHTSEMLKLQGALPFLLKIAGIILKKHEFIEKDELYLVSDEQLERMASIRHRALHNLFTIACQLYQLSNPTRRMTDVEYGIEWTEVKKAIDYEMRELRTDLCNFVWEKKKFYTSIKKVYNPESLFVLVNKFNQLPPDFAPQDLEPIDEQFNPMGLVLRHEAREAFEAMCKQAMLEGIKLEAISTYRSYDYQHKVYYKNMNSDVELGEYQAIRDKVSARAGHSEHQTGLAVDINDLEQTFEDTPEGKWLAENSHRFGFILRYPKGTEHITGYDYEPWHFRYLGLDLAEDVYQSSLTYDQYYHKFISPLDDNQRYI